MVWTEASEPRTPSPPTRQDETQGPLRHALSFTQRHVIFPVRRSSQFPGHLCDDNASVSQGTL